VSEAPALHPDAAHLGWLVGAWSGVGKGAYPTIGDFDFEQQVVFAHDGRPFLTYSSRTWLLDGEGNRVRPTGTESGFWRARPDNGVEVTLAHPTGYAEIWVGGVTVTAIDNARITGARAELSTDVVARTESAKVYTGGTRMYGLVEGELLWTFDMAAVEQSLQSHLWARLRPFGAAAPEGD